MAKTLSKTGITTSSTIESWHVSQSVDALTGTDAYDVTISGSLSLPGSTASGSFIGDGSGLTGITAEWDGSHNGNASITGSLTVTSNVSSSSNLFGDRIFATSYVATPTLQSSTSDTVLIDDNLNVNGNITASGHVSSSATSTASFGTYLGDGSQLTGVTSEWDGTRNGNAEITGSLIVTSDISSSGDLYSIGLITSGSRIRRYRTITLDDSNFNSSPSQQIQNDDDVILIIDNTTLLPSAGTGSLGVSNFFNQPAGRCVELVKIKDGSGGGIILKGVSMANPDALYLNDSSQSGGTRTICSNVGESIILMSYGLSDTGSAWGNGY